MARQVSWIDRSPPLAERLARVGSGPLALDSEADSFHHYREKVCLIQLSFGESDLLVDSLADVDMAPLAERLRDPELRKILHGADYDVRMLRRDFGFEIRGMFDTMIAARLVGERSFGLSSLLERFFDVSLDKRFQRADWSRRPLTEGMRRYAVMDTRYLAELAQRLADKLEVLGRSSWAAEEFERLESLRWSADRRPEEAYLRLKGIHALVGGELGAARELAALRERRARERDLPPFRVLRDTVLLDLVRSAPTEENDLPGIPGIPRAWTRGAAARELLEALERGRSVPDDAMPRLPPRKPRRDPALEKRIKEARHGRDRVAAELDLEPAVVASRSLLEETLLCLDRGGSLDRVEGMRRWQARLLAPVFEGLGG